MRWRLALPVVVLIALIGVLSYSLTRQPGVLPSALLGKKAPSFDLPTLATEHGATKNGSITAADLKGNVTLVNFWASWCEACRAEHPLISEIAQRTGVPVIGFNYKDTRLHARQWLKRYGNPFSVVALDTSGRVGINWGVSAVPETFVVDRSGTIRDKIVGSITRKVMNNRLVPELKRLRDGT